MVVNKMSKSKRVLIEVIGGTACLVIGFSSKSVMDRTNIATKVETQANKSVIASSEKIAVVNLDTGVDKSGKTVFYSNTLIQYPNQNYQTVSLEEAKSGVENGKYAAYIIIPSGFSESVESINGTPKQSEILYKFSTYLSDKSKEKMIYEVNQFERQICFNISYVYLDAILDDFHKVQDQSKIILNNDSEDLNSIQAVVPEKLVETIAFQEVTRKEEKIKDITLAKEEKSMQRGIKGIETNYNNALENGKKDYKDIVSNKKLVDDALGILKGKIEAFQPFTDEKGTSYIQTGMASLNSEVFACNEDMQTKRSDLTSAICEEINQNGSYHESKIADHNKDVQEKIDTVVIQDLQKPLNEYLKQNNESLEKYLKEQNEQIEFAVGQYANDIQAYLNDSITSSTAKGMIKAISELHAKEAYEKEQVLMEPYILNQIERGAAVKYNELADKQSETLDKVENCARELDIAVQKLNGTYVEPVSSEEPEGGGESAVSEPPAQPEDYKTLVLQKSIELKEALAELSTLSKVEVPENIPKPEVLPEVDQDTIDMNAFTSLVGLQHGVDSNGNEINQPTVNLTYDPLSYEIKKEDITYRIPEYKIPIVSSVDNTKLEKIESFYTLDPARFSSVVQKNLVDAIEERNKVLKEDAKKGMNDFVKEQTDYQVSLDAFNPFSYVDTEQIKEDAGKISGQITDIVRSVNDINTSYRSYLSDFTSETNENIQSLKENMTKANDKTKKNVQSEMAAIQNMRYKTSCENVDMLKGFAGKLGFTRVGDLPKRETYQFMVNPVRYQADSNTGLK